MAIDNLGNPETLKFGLKVSDNANTDNYAAFDWFRVDCSDRVPPTTTAKLPSPGSASWAGGATAPTVTLTADDGALGDVERVSLPDRRRGTSLRPTRGPFTVGRSG